MNKQYGASPAGGFDSGVRRLELAPERPPASDTNSVCDARTPRASMPECGQRPHVGQPDMPRQHAELVRTPATAPPARRSTLAHAPANALAAGASESSHHRASALDQLLQEADLFHTPDRVPYATVRSEGRRETLPVHGKAFRSWLSRWLYDHGGAVPKSHALRDMQQTLAGLAEHKGPERPAFLRKAEREGSLYLDLANPAGQVVAITAAGWQVADDPPVRFRRPRGLLPLPVPVPGGSLDELRPFVNVGSDDDFRLVLAWLLAALGPHRPYLVLAIHGEQGAAKSTLARVLRRLTDPNQAELRHDLRGSWDLAIAAQHSLMVVLDNLRALPPWLSDTLCCLATGGAFTTRQLFTDDEETIFQAMRPLLLTSIGEVATAPDLLDRALPICLPAIPDARRQCEEAFWQSFEAARPRILGALLDAVSLGLRRLPAAGAERLPRMADFARWGIAVEPALGWEPGGFLRAYQENRGEAIRLVLDISPLADPIRELVAEGGEWTGTCKELLPLLAARAGDAARARSGWPGNPEALSHALRRLAPNLRAAGVEIAFLPRTGSGRPIRLCACDPAAPAATSPMTVGRKAA
jgi:hypothetical protein